MNWRKRLPSKPGLYWTRRGSDDEQPGIVEIVQAEGLEVRRFGADRSQSLEQFARGEAGSVPAQFFGPLKAPKHGKPREEWAAPPPPEPDPVAERFEKQTSVEVVLAMVNEHVKGLSPAALGSIPKSCRPALPIKSVQELTDLQERLWNYAMGEDVSADHEALAHFAQQAMFRAEELAFDPEYFDEEEPDEGEPPGKRG